MDKLLKKYSICRSFETTRLSQESTVMNQSIAYSLFNFISSGFQHKCHQFYAEKRNRWVNAHTSPLRGRTLYFQFSSHVGQVHINQVSLNYKLLTFRNYYEIPKRVILTVTRMLCKTYQFVENWSLWKGLQFHIRHHWNGHAIILMNFSSLATKVLIRTTFVADSEKMPVRHFHFQRWVLKSKQKYPNQILKIRPWHPLPLPERPSITVE